MGCGIGRLKYEMTPETIDYNQFETKLGVQDLDVTYTR